MPSLKPIDIFQKYSRTCLARVSVRTPLGDLATGTAFHIGNGYLVTARHVVEGNELVEVEGGWEKVEVKGVILADEAGIDLAAMETSFQSGRGKVRVMAGEREVELADYIELGGHLDDWVGEEFVLSKAVVMGYPPIPLARAPTIVALESEVNAVVDRYDGPHPHFILSGIPRGGFSGGPAFSEWGFLLGVMTASLYDGDKDYELGFMAAISVEPLLALIHEKSIACGENLRLARKLCS